MNKIAHRPLVASRRGELDLVDAEAAITDEVELKMIFGVEVLARAFVFKGSPRDDGLLLLGLEGGFDVQTSASCARQKVGGLKAALPFLARSSPMKPRMGQPESVPCLSTAW